MLQNLSQKIPNKIGHPRLDCGNKINQTKYLKPIAVFPFVFVSQIWEGGGGGEYERLSMKSFNDQVYKCGLNIEYIPHHFLMHFCV